MSLASGGAAPIQEIFSSVQGEAIYVGKRQVFVRFAHCHLKCAYCDTTMTTPDGLCHLESSPGTGKLEKLPNPVSVETLLSILSTLLPQAHHHSISFTGGEPLLYHRFLAELFPQIHSRFVPVKTYLETSGTQPEFLAPLLASTDIIAMDIKLPSATREAPRYDEHAAFYQLVRTRPEAELFIKLIFNAQTTAEELDAVRMIVTDRVTPIILQPETLLSVSNNVQSGTALRPMSSATLLRIEKQLSDWFKDVRVIPQTHKMLQVL